MNDIYQYISTLHQRRGRPSSGIVYCRTRATCDELASYLRGKGLSARPYHRGIRCILIIEYHVCDHCSIFLPLFIRASTLDKTLQEWEDGGSGEGGVDVVRSLREIFTSTCSILYWFVPRQVCATIAFGMGIDKADVRWGRPLLLIWLESWPTSRYIIHYDLPKSFEGTINSCIEVLYMKWKSGYQVTIKKQVCQDLGDSHVILRSLKVVPAEMV